jgi:hypothetical protein
MIKSKQKQTYFPFLEATNYNPLNNLQPVNNFIYFKYTNSIVSSDTEFFHTIDPNISGNINILYVGGGGLGGSADSSTGGGGGGSGGEVIITKVPNDSFTDNKIKFKIGNVNSTTSIYNFKSGANYTASSGNNGSDGTKNKTWDDLSYRGNGGRGANGISKRGNIGSYTVGYGGGAGGGGGGYSDGDNGSDGDMIGFKQDVDCGYETSNFSCPWYILISDIGDNTGKIRTAYGGVGNSGNKPGSDGNQGYVLIYYTVNDSEFSLKSASDSMLTAGQIYYGYNPLGKYISQNFTKNISECCYIYLNNPGTVSNDDITTINNVIGSNNYNVLAVGGGGGGGGGGNSYGDNFDKGNLINYVGVGGGGGSRGAFVDKVNINDKITSIVIGKVGSNGKVNGGAGGNGEDGGKTIFNTFSADNSFSVNGGSGGAGAITSYQLPNYRTPRAGKGLTNDGGASRGIDAAYQMNRKYVGQADFNSSDQFGASKISNDFLNQISTKPGEPFLPLGPESVFFTVMP